MMLPYLIISLGFLVTATNGIILGCLVRNPCQHMCRDRIWPLFGYDCLCNQGYMVDPYDRHKCKPRAQACGRGYENSKTPPYNCNDINECSSGTSACQQNCQNTEGGYICSCKPGYVVSKIDHTKCETRAPSCGRGYENSKTPPYNCVDINECSSGTSRCQQNCQNTQGSYICSCGSGYVVSKSDHTKCEPVDKCSTSPCEHTCTNTASGVLCSCRRGYNISPNDNSKCVDIDECSKDKPCEHTCVNSKGSYKCSCNDGFSVDPKNKNKCVGTDACSMGKRCEHICSITSTGRICSCRPGFVVNEEDNTLCDKTERCNVFGDILMVFDSSSSIGVDHYDKQFVFAKRLTGNFDIGETALRIGGIVFSRFTKVLFNLKDHNNIESLHKALSNVEYMESSTYTHEAFETIGKQQLFSPAKGGRVKAPDVIVLFTDGTPTFKDATIDAAQNLKNSAVSIICVGIGKDLDMAVLKKISSTPEDVVAASNYDTLDNIEKRLTKLLCEHSKPI